MSTIGKSELNVGNGYAVNVLESLEPKQVRVSRGSDEWASKSMSISRLETSRHVQVVHVANERLWPDASHRAQSRERYANGPRTGMATGPNSLSLEASGSRQPCVWRYSNSDLVLASDTCSAMRTRTCHQRCEPPAQSAGRWNQCGAHRSGTCPQSKRQRSAALSAYRFSGGLWPWSLSSLDFYSKIWIPITKLKCKWTVWHFCQTVIEQTVHIYTVLSV